MEAEATGLRVADGLDQWVVLEVVQGRGAPVEVAILEEEVGLEEEDPVIHGKKHRTIKTYHA